MKKFRVKFLSRDGSTPDPVVIEAVTFLNSQVGTTVFVDANGVALAAIGQVNVESILPVEGENA